MHLREINCLLKISSEEQNSISRGGRWDRNFSLLHGELG